MYLLYSIFLLLWGILLIPAFIYRVWIRKKRLPGLSQRFGRLPESLKFDGRPTIWFHACSVGETLSLQPLVQELQERLPGVRFVFSTITETGQRIAAKNFAAYGSGNTFYFPVDFTFVTTRVLRHIMPAMLVIIDTEIWPNLVSLAYRRGIPVALANGRISGSSFRYYRWAKPFLRRVFQNYGLFMMQSQEDALRISKMGAPSEKILVTGNIKFDRNMVEQERGRATDALETEFGLAGTEAPLIIAGSTHPGEEEILLEVLRKIRELPDLGRVSLLLAPRHPERFEEVAALVVRKGFTLQRRTEAVSRSDRADVLLLDTVGELAAVYRFATVAFVGGSMVCHGGHSIMEPALYAKAIVVGPSMENFRGILDEFRSGRALRQISAGEEKRGQQVEQLTSEFVNLLQNAPERESLGAAAFSILEKSRGATARTADQIVAIFRERNAGSVGAQVKQSRERSEAE